MKISVSKDSRSKKSQRGQFMTPLLLSGKIVSDMEFSIDTVVLEPSFGEGSFVLNIIDKFIDLYKGTVEQRLAMVLSKNVYGVELDKNLYDKCLDNIKQKYGYLPDTHNLVNEDFLFWNIEEFDRQCFDYIIGNPPFGGTINKEDHKFVEKAYGSRYGMKIKKETYSMFIVHAIEMLNITGKIVFICSDTFKTINTMKGLRHLLMKDGSVSIDDISRFSDETSYGMVLIQYLHGDEEHYVCNNGETLPNKLINTTENLSWNIKPEYEKYFNGTVLSEYITCSSGMTTGKNEYFIREVVDGYIYENFKFEFFDDPINLQNEIDRSQLKRLGVRKLKEVKELVAENAVRRNIRITKRKEPVKIKLPHEDYIPYNKASKDLLYSPLRNMIYWKDDGDALYTFKKNGNWYLHGVGGKPFFFREGLTWNLISSKITVRYLPSGYVLDSGAPVGVLNDNIDKDELYFIIGWLITSISNDILKTCINHTKNIQSKDIERLPYPFWVKRADKIRIVRLIKDRLSLTEFDSDELVETLDNIFHVK